MSYNFDFNFDDDLDSVMNNAPVAAPPAPPDVVPVPVVAPVPSAVYAPEPEPTSQPEMTPTPTSMSAASVAAPVSAVSPVYILLYPDWKELYALYDRIMYPGSKQTPLAASICVRTLGVGADPSDDFSTFTISSDNALHAHALINFAMKPLWTIADKLVKGGCTLKEFRIEVHQRLLYILLESADPDVLKKL